MGAGSRVVSKPDAEVLDVGVRILLLDLLDVDNLAGHLLHLLKALQEVPEARLGDHMVRREDPHAVQRRMWLRLRRDLATHDLVLTQL